MTKGESAARTTTPMPAASPTGKDAPAAAAAAAAGKGKATRKPTERVTIGIIVPIALFGALGYALTLAYKAGKEANVDNPFSQTSLAAPALSTLAYFVFVFVGPKVMAKRQPMKLKNWMLMYNVYQTIFNIWACYAFVKAVADLGMSWWGNELDLSARSFDLGFWIWLHYTNKYLELLDTTFMILRKKSEQVSFLHVYHHCLLIWAWFLVCRVAAGGDAYFGALANSFIHVLMYSYYAMALLRIPVPWKRFLTQLQMVQFVLCASHTFYVMYLGVYPFNMCLLELWVMFNMLFLFYNFYSERYNRGKVKWTIIDGVRYDITDFFKSHPGGADLLMLAVGRDATVMFHSYHRRYKVVNKRLEGMPVLEELPERRKDGSRLRGTVLDEHRDRQIVGQYATIGTSKLYKELKDGVNEYFATTGKKSRGGMLLKSVALLVATGAAYYATAVLGYFYVGPLLGVFMAINGLAIQHDANHGAFSANPVLNRLAGLVDDLIGGSALMWRHQHDIAHHAHPNDVKLDADTFENFPVMRLNPELPLRWYLKYQHIYGPFLYTLLGISYPIGDLMNYFKGRYVHVRLQPLRFMDKFFFFAGKVVHYGLVLGLPIYFHGAWTGFFCFFLPVQLAGGFFLASVFAVSHNSHVVEYNIPHDTDWAELQIRTSCNWGPKSPFWLYTAGGLNFQIEHHLFPGVAHIHYPAIAKIVKAICKKHNVPYGEFQKFRHLYSSHLQTLKHLGSNKSMGNYKKD